MPRLSLSQARERLNPASRNWLDARSKNFLVNRILVEFLDWSARKYARGRLVDIGCGLKPYAPLFAGLVEEYVGVDHAESPHAADFVDVRADAYDTTLPSGYADTVLSSAVLEHLEEPQAALCEAARVLKPGGHLIMACPMFWQLHEQPRDFFRYTPYGITHLCRGAGLEVVELLPMSGFVVTFAQEACYFLRRYDTRRWMRPLLGLCVWGLQSAGSMVRRRDLSTDFSWMNLVVARKPGNDTHCLS